MVARKNATTIHKHVTLFLKMKQDDDSPPEYSTVCHGNETGRYGKFDISGPKTFDLKKGWQFVQSPLE